LEELEEMFELGEGVIKTPPNAARQQVGVAKANEARGIGEVSIWRKRITINDEEEMMNTGGEMMSRRRRRRRKTKKSSKKERRRRKASEYRKVLLSSLSS
jgi:hypothetical protein